MNLYGWLEALRRRPLEERRQFAATLTVIIMAVITTVWFVSFFATLPEKLKSNDTEPATATASVISGVDKPDAPFSGN